jgi:hypothetical protein
MFYEEKLVDGVLYCRGSPSAEFEPKEASRHTEAVKALWHMTPQARLRAMKWFCRACGVEQGERSCQCENDE